MCLEALYRIEVTGNTYRAFANGSATPTTQYTSAAYPSGQFALRGTGQSYDNLCVSTGLLAGPPDGDLNGDGVANGADIQEFVNAVLVGANAPNILAHGDFNHNGIIDAGDEPGFVAALLGP